jgi:hypothetical protein
MLLCCVYRSLLYCNIPLDLCTLCLSCYYFYIVLSLYLYCCYVVYIDHYFTVIYLQTFVVCVFLVIISTLFYLYTCTVAMCVPRSSLYCNIPSDLCTLCFYNKTNTEYTSLKVYYSKVMICIHNITTVQV